MQKQSSPAPFSLLVVALLLTVLTILYLYLHQAFPEDGFFWLHGRGIIAEVVIWSFVGALIHAFLAFSESLALPKSDRHYPAVMSCVLQALFAPVFALLLFYATFYVKDEQTMDKSFLFLSFIAGLLSGQLFVAAKGWFSLPANNAEYKPASFGAGSELQTEGFQEAAKEKEAPYGLAILSAVTVSLQLDDAGLFYDEKKEVHKTGFDSASVTLQSAVHGDILNAGRMGSGNAFVFVFHAVAEGDYTLRALQCLRMPDKSVLYLFGERQIGVAGEDLRISLSLRKVQD